MINALQLRRKRTVRFIDDEWRLRLKGRPGILYGLSGLIAAGYFTYVSTSMLDVYTMQGIVAVVIGGTVLTGGKGSYFGTIAGALFMVVLNNCLAVLSVKDCIQNIIKGLVIIGVLTLYNRDKAVRQ